ncbi:MAG: methyl-accepting chemotaxis protein [Solirubrobacteraceae bacterium]
MLPPSMTGEGELRSFAAAVKAMVAGIGAAASSAGVDAARSAADVGTVSREVERLREDVDGVARSLQALGAGSERAAQSACDAAALTDELAGDTERGLGLAEGVLASVHEMQLRMTAIGERVERLSEDLKTITGVSVMINTIADQTKLLALNAAIEAARAGEHGRGFAIVAKEVGRLAQSTREQTAEIDATLRATHCDLEAVQGATRAGIEEASRGVESATAAGEALERIGTPVARSTEPAANIAAAAEQQMASLQEVAGHVARMESVDRLAQESSQLARDVFVLAQHSEMTHSAIAGFYVGSFVDHAAGLAHRLAARLQEILEGAIDRGAVTLDGVLEYRYREIKSREVAGLARLFDVSRVPAEGFTPAKYRTVYDALVDEAMQPVIDETLSREPRFVFALPLDLNAYAPIHNSAFCQDWTGDPDRDLPGNRVKRFFCDSDVLVRGARVGLGAHVAANQATRDQFRRAGCTLAEPADGARARLVQTYARDTGALLTVLTVPLYVKGQRFGAVLTGWDPEKA